MKLPDPEGLRAKLQKNSYIFATSEDELSRKKKNNSFVAEDPCFILSHGLDTYSHADVAAALTTSSALWSIHLLQQRHTYWSKKKLVGERLVRSVHLALYNKQKEKKFKNGLASTFVTLLFGEKIFCVYGVGFPQAYLFDFGKAKLTQLTTPQKDIVCLGIERKEPHHLFYSDSLHHESMFVLSTISLEDCMASSDLENLCKQTKPTKISMQESCEYIITIANKRNVNNLMVSMITYF